MDKIILLWIPQGIIILITVIFILVEEGVIWKQKHGKYY